MLKFKKLGCVMLAAALGVAGMTRAAGAATSYSYNYLPGQSNYTVPLGGSVQVNVYLQETNSDQSSNSFLNNENGLSNASLSVSPVSGTGYITDIVGNPNTSNLDDGSGFDPSTTSAAAAPNGAPAGTFSLLENTGFDLSNGVLAGAQTNGVSKVFLGVLTIHAGSNVGDVATFSVGQYDPSNPGNNTLTSLNGYNLDINPDPQNLPYDDAAANNFTVTTEEASPVPEPGTAMILLPGVMWLLAGRPRKLRPQHGILADPDGLI